MLVMCAWDGPDPRPGEWVAGKRGGPLLIRSVRPRPGQQHRLVLELQRPRSGQSVPAGAIVHPQRRYAPHDKSGPERSRQLAHDGGAAVIEGKWRDPDDTRPGAAQKPRHVRGWRAYCPLRRIAALRGSQITERHIAAADHLRLLYDLARLGPLSGRDVEAVDGGFGPMAGPPATAQTQCHASEMLRAALRPFTPGQQRMLAVVLLDARSVYAWSILEASRLELAKPLDQKLETGKLIALLDVLAEHFADEVNAALFGGVVL